MLIIINFQHNAGAKKIKELLFLPKKEASGTEEYIEKRMGNREPGTPMLSSPGTENMGFAYVGLDKILNDLQQEGFGLVDAYFRKARYVSDPKTQKMTKSSERISRIVLSDDFSLSEVERRKRNLPTKEEASFLFEVYIRLFEQNSVTAPLLFLWDNNGKVSIDIAHLSPKDERFMPGMKMLRYNEPLLSLRRDKSGFRIEKMRLG